MSPEVWTDVRQRVGAVASGIGLRVVWPNEDAVPPVGIAEPQPKPFLDIEVAGQITVPVEITSQIWQEQGTIFLHVMIPVGTGVDNGLAVRKQFSEAFRQVTDAPEGLTYWDQSFDPLGPSTDDGVYRALSLLVRYYYQDITLPQRLFSTFPPTLRRLPNGTLSDA
jgi:hypothetical protein